MEIITSSEDDEVMGVFKPETGFIDGVMEGTFKYPCGQCGGDGKVFNITPDPKFVTSLMSLQRIDCHECEGKGFIIEPATITLPKDGDHDS